MSVEADLVFEQRRPSAEAANDDWSPRAFVRQQGRLSPVVADSLSGSDGWSGEPVIFKDGLFVAPLLVALQAAAPAAVCISMLYCAAHLYGIVFGPPLIVLAILAAALSCVIVQQPRNVVSRLMGSKTSIVVALNLRWAALLIALFAVGWMTGYFEEYSRRMLATWAVLSPVALTGTVLLLRELAWRHMVVPCNVRNVVFVGCTEMSMRLASRMARHSELSMSVLGFFDDRARIRLGQYGRERLLGNLSELPDFVRKHKVDAIYIALPLRDVKRVQQLVAQLQDTTASVYYLPDVPASHPVQARSCDLLGTPVVALCEAPFFGCRAAVKRLMDLVISSAALIVLAPLLIGVAIAVKATSPGPAIFRQRRYGLNGQEIVVYKFRTMTVTEDGPNVKQATKHDSRTTPLGRFLRKCSIDELPQLINVVQGRMSLVGPRPMALAHNEEYRRLVRGYMLRHKVLPGLTGLAQVNGYRGEISRYDELEARVKSDLEYLHNWSPLLDLKILLLTIPRLLGAEKAY